MLNLLQTYFGYASFRPLQKEVIDNVLAGKHSFVLMPTGGGKSLCYQLPALKFAGVTLVVSPLIALMKDQVDSLKANGIGAEFINSSLPPWQIGEIQTKALAGQIKLLYLAPERLAIGHFQDFLKQLKVSLIAIDEAHCISEWGHDFRPDYRNLKSLKNIFPSAPLIALTATATAHVREDIIRQLEIPAARQFVFSFNRENLKISVADKKNALPKLLAILRRHQSESAIVYCFSRKETEELAGDLRANGFSALAYHAGMDHATRQNAQEKFIRDEVNIITATIAFGMGIDKPNVRVVVHYTLPKSIEGYYQEIGRAGRDGLPSECVLFYTFADKRKHDFFIDKTEDPAERQNQREKLQKVLDFASSRSCRRKYLLRYFGENFAPDNCGACDICLNKKEKRQEADFDVALFQKLRVLRRKLAEELNVPPFVIFGDVSLREMARFLPVDKSGFSRITGVGAQKLERFGTDFLAIIKAHVAENGLQIAAIPELEKAVKTTRYEKTRLGVAKKLSLTAMATEQGFRTSTIASHIEKLMESGEKLDIGYLLPTGEKLTLIERAFAKRGTERLAPVFEELGGEIDYDTLRLVRFFIADA